MLASIAGEHSSNHLVETVVASPPIFPAFGTNLALRRIYDVVPSGPLGVALATVVLMFLGHDLDQERRTDAADVLAVIDGLPLEFVDADALRCGGSVTL